MVLSGARIYFDGVGIGYETQERIQQIVKKIKAVSPSTEVSMRFLKCGQIYEGLLWGTANGTPIGIYKRGISISQVLESLYKQVRKECVRICKVSRRQSVTGKKSNFDREASLAMAG